MCVYATVAIEPCIEHASGKKSIKSSIKLKWKIKKKNENKLIDGSRRLNMNIHKIGQICMRSIAITKIMNIIMKYHRCLTRECGREGVIYIFLFFIHSEFVVLCFKREIKKNIELYMTHHHPIPSHHLHK